MRTLFRRQKYLLDFTLASLMRRKAKNIALLLVYTATVFVLASVMLFTEALRQEATLILAEAPELIVQRLVAGRHDLMPAERVQELSGIRGVVAVHGRLWGYYFDPVVRANYTVMVPTDRHLAADEIVIGTGLSRARGIDVGDYLSLRAPAGQPHTFKVTGTLDHASELVSADLMLMSEPTYRDFFGVPADVYTDLALEVRNPREIGTIARKVLLKLPDTRAIAREEILRTYGALFNWRAGLVLVVLGGAILAFGIFAWDRAAGLSGEEQREIGVLKAIGWETSDILAMKCWEGVVVSLTAFLIGYTLAYLHVFYGSANLFEPVMKGWSVLYADFRPKPLIDLLQIAALFFFTVFPYSAATIIPVWRVATTEPDVAMR